MEARENCISWGHLSVVHATPTNDRQLRTSERPSIELARRFSCTAVGRAYQSKLIYPSHKETQSAGKINDSVSNTCMKFIDSTLVQRRGMPYVTSEEDSRTWPRGEWPIPGAWNRIEIGVWIPFTVLLMPTLLCLLFMRILSKNLVHDNPCQRLITECNHDIGTAPPIHKVGPPHKVKPGGLPICTGGTTWDQDM